MILDGTKAEIDMQICREICERVAAGEVVMTVLDSDRVRFPSWATFRKWKVESPELYSMYLQAIQDKTEYLTKEIFETMNDVKAGLIKADAANVIINTLKWAAAKYYPKMYGERVDIRSGDGSMSPSRDFINEKTETVQQILKRLESGDFKAD